ncbi:MAG: GntR family transcriptional regulator [Anaerolineae bacterium]|nr:MAG: GntR family transcriptional regulator [Anaerolineae bacterium]
MDFSIDRSSGIPYYVQVRQALQEHLETGTWKPGEQLPSEPELCRLFGVSRPVIRQALNELAQRGLVTRAKGKGTFAAPPKITEALVQKLTGFYQDMVEQGYTPTARVLRQEAIPAGRQVAERLKIPVGTPVVVIERLRFVQDEPIQLVTTYIPRDACPALLEVDLTHRSLYAFLEAECGIMIVRGRRTVEAVAANEYEAEMLRVKKGAPLILLDSVSYLSDGTPIEYYHALHRGDRTRFEVELVRVREPGDRQALVEQHFDPQVVTQGVVLVPPSRAGRGKGATGKAKT